MQGCARSESSGDVFDRTFLLLGSVGSAGRENGGGRRNRVRCVGDEDPDGWRW